MPDNLGVESGNTFFPPVPKVLLTQLALEQELETAYLVEFGVEAPASERNRTNKNKTGKHSAGAAFALQKGLNTS